MSVKSATATLWPLFVNFVYWLFCMTLYHSTPFHKKETARFYPKCEIKYDIKIQNSGRAKGLRSKVKPRKWSTAVERF